MELSGKEGGGSRELRGAFTSLSVKRWVYRCRPRFSRKVSTGIASCGSASSGPAMGLTSPPGPARFPAPLRADPRGGKLLSIIVILRLPSFAQVCSSRAAKKRCHQESKEQVEFFF